MTSNILKINGNIFKINPDLYEPNSQFNFRYYFIRNLKPKSKEDFEKALTMSYIARNIRFLHCSYDDLLMKKIQTYINKM